MAKKKEIQTTETPAETVQEAQATVEVSSPAVVEASSSSVVVALNWPHNIKFKLFGDRRADGTRKLIKTVEINGNARQLVGQNKGVLPTGGQFGFTTVDAADWAAIEQQYGFLQIFKSGLAFACKNYADAQKEAKRRSELRFGREPVDPATTHTEPAKRD